MKQTLPDIIKQNDALRQVLLSQKGGIMKYLAENLDADGLAPLFRNYQELCAQAFYEGHKWDLHRVRERDEMKRTALGYDHLFRELRFQRELKQALSEMPADVAETIIDATELYLAWAYRQNRQRWYPDGMTPLDIYREVIGLYSPQGLAYKCMIIILREHHANGEVEKTEADLYEEFRIRQYVAQLDDKEFAQMRQAVAEMLKGRTSECRQMAIDTMEMVRGFSQKIYSDEVVRSLRQMKYTQEAKHCKRDGEWLQSEVQRASMEVFSGHIKTHSMAFYFAIFVDLLRDVGRIWAAQLLAHDIDMKTLEKEVCCVLYSTKDIRYYVDKYYSNDLPGTYCISNYDMAKEILKRLGQKTPKMNYLSVAVGTTEEEAKNKLSKAYIKLKKEGFLDDKTELTPFVDVLMYNSDGKIVWLNDDGYKFLRTLIRVFLHQQNDYSFDAILKVNKGGSYAIFVCNHFVDKDNRPLDFKTNGHIVGKKETVRFEGILEAIYGGPI